MEKILFVGTRPFVTRRDSIRRSDVKKFDVGEGEEKSDDSSLTVEFFSSLNFFFPATKKKNSSLSLELFFFLTEKKFSGAFSQNARTIFSLKKLCTRFYKNRENDFLKKKS